RELGATFERRFCAAHAQHVYAEERGRRQRAIRQRKVGAGGKAAIGQHLLELGEGGGVLGGGFVGHLLLAGLGIHLREQCAQRGFQVEIVKARERPYPRAALGRLRQQRRRRKFFFQVLIDGFRLWNHHTVSIEGGNFAERIQLQVFGGFGVVARNRDDVDLGALVINRDPAFGREIRKIHVVELHGG